jgi:hypothetical protein
MALQAVPDGGKGGKGEGPGDSGATQEEKAWDWHYEVDQAARIMHVVQQNLNGLGDNQIGPEDAEFYAWASILGMARERLQDMLQGKPYRPVPGDSD